MRKQTLFQVLSIAFPGGVAIAAAALFAGPGMGVEPTLKASVVHNLAVSEETRVHVAQADGAAGDRPVTYADDQADRGEKKFQGDCADCHGADLRGGLNGGPPLRGMAFEQTFADGAPASGLFMFMSTQMPPNDPGRYSPSQYADLMAFILKLNAFQPGAPLPSNTDELDHLVMKK